MPAVQPLILNLVLADKIGDLARQNHPIAFALECLTHNFFGHAIHISISRIDKIHTGIQSRIHHANRRSLIGLIAKCHRSQTYTRHANARPS